MGKSIIHNPLIRQKWAKEFLERTKNNKLTEEDIDNWIRLLEDFTNCLQQQWLSTKNDKKQ